MVSFDSSDSIRAESMAEFAAVIREHGPLIRLPLAARLCAVSRQYLVRLTEEGRFRKYFVQGELHLAEAAVLEWMGSR
jgi:hypothetical protein